MAKLSLNTRPGPFTKKLTIPCAASEPVEVTFTLKYRTRTELAKFNDDYMEDARKRAESFTEKVKAAAAAAAAATEEGAEPVPFKPMSDYELTEQLNAAAAQYVMDVAEAWDCEEPLTLENALRFADLYPAAVPQLAKVYNETLKEGRSGN